MANIAKRPRWPLARARYRDATGKGRYSRAAPDA